MKTTRKILKQQGMHPTQPLKKDRLGTLRFKDNAIVRYLLDWATVRGMSLNELAQLPFSNEDRVQLAQLIGYSLSGFGELSYVSDAAYARAETEGQPRPAVRKKT